MTQEEKKKKFAGLLFVSFLFTTFAPRFQLRGAKIVCICSTEAEIIPMNLIRVMPA